MEVLKNKHTLKEDFDNKKFSYHYALDKNIPEAEKLSKISGSYRLLLRSCPNPDELKNPLVMFDFIIAAYSPHVSLEEHNQLCDDGMHWNAKKLTRDGACWSYYPTLEMVQRANRICIPRNHLVRYIKYRLNNKGLVVELFDWKYPGI